MNTKTHSQNVMAKWRLGLGGVAAVLVVALIVSPSAQALAQDFLNLFRVKRFQPVTVDPARLQQLQSSSFDIQSLLSSSTEVLKNPGEPKVVNDAQAAGQLAGFTVRTPGVLPAGTTLQDVRIQGEASVRFTADTARLQSLLDVAGITDVQLPPALNGKSVTVNKPPLVILNYTSAKDHLTLMQSHNPQVQLPDGVDIAQLGEIALRFSGMPAAEARTFARSIDWSSTLLVPISANTTSFTRVRVGNAEGLLIATSGMTLPAKDASIISTARPAGSTLVWADGDMVYAINTTNAMGLTDIATSLK